MGRQRKEVIDFDRGTESGGNFIGKVSFEFLNTFPSSKKVFTRAGTGQGSGTET